MTMRDGIIENSVKLKMKPQALLVKGAIDELLGKCV